MSLLPFFYSHYLLALSTRFFSLSSPLASRSSPSFLNPSLFSLAATFAIPRYPIFPHFCLSIPGESNIAVPIYFLPFLPPRHFFISTMSHPALRFAFYSSLPLVSPSLSMAFALVYISSRLRFCCGAAFAFVVLLSALLRWLLHLLPVSLLALLITLPDLSFLRDHSSTFDLSPSSDGILTIVTRFSTLILDSRIPSSLNCLSILFSILFPSLSLFPFASPSSNPFFTFPSHLSLFPIFSCLLSTSDVALWFAFRVFLWNATFPPISLFSFL